MGARAVDCTSGVCGIWLAYRLLPCLGRRREGLGGGVGWRKIPTGLEFRASTRVQEPNSAAESER